MKLTCAQIKGIAEGVRETNFKEWELPLGLSLQLSRVVDAVIKEETLIEQEREKRLKKYADKDEEGNLVVSDGQAVLSTEEARRSFAEEFNDLLIEEIDIKEIDAVKLDYNALNQIGLYKKPKEIYWLLNLLQDVSFDIKGEVE